MQWKKEQKMGQVCHRRGNTNGHRSHEKMIKLLSNKINTS